MALTKTRLLKHDFPVHGNSLAIIYVIVIDAFAQWEQSHTHQLFFSTIFVNCTCNLARKQFAKDVFVSNVFWKSPTGIPAKGWGKTP